MKARLAFATAALALVLVPSALASHSFTDVPDTHPFHYEIGIFKDTNITTGCTASTFCPDAFVKRQAMAAFIDRALGLVVRPGETTQKGVPGSRVAMLDDDLSLVGTDGNVLRLQAPSNNVVGGFSGNSVIAGVSGATIAGGGFSGSPNRVSGGWGSVGGGIGNTASGYSSAVAGGVANTASGFYSAVAGGSGNEAFGDGSFAAGRRAHARLGSFHFGDGNWSGGDTYSSDDYSFSAHATGGVHFWTNATGATTGCWIFPGGGTWSCSSDKNAKENFRAVDSRQVLQRVARLPISSWNYKGQNDRFRHLGPSAQDFKAAFALGEDDKSIAMVDADGISLAAIQALYEQSRAKDARIGRLNARLAALERTVAKLSRESE